MITSLTVDIPNSLLFWIEFRYTDWQYVRQTDYCYYYME